MRNIYISLLFVIVCFGIAYSQNYSIPQAQVHSAIYVDSVQLNNATSNSIALSQNCTSTSSFGNYSNLTAQVQAGSTYSLDVSLATCNGTFYNSILEAWIDYNDNGVFESNESILVNNVSVAGSDNYVFTIPSTAVNGLVKMRIMLEKGGIAPLDGNQNIAIGNILDFSVIINGGVCSPISNLTSYGITANSIGFSFISGQATEFIVEYGPLGFQQGTGSTMTILTASGTLVGLTPNSTYEICVRAICAPGDTSASSCIIAATSNLPLYINNVPGQCPSFIDISSIGTNLNLTNGQTTGLTLPFGFEFQGQLINNVTVGHDGALILGTQTGTIGTDIASSTQNGLFVFNQALSAYTNGVLTDGVYSFTQGTTPNRKFIVQWKDRGFISTTQNNADRINFEIVLEESTGNCYFIYDDVNFSNPLYDYGKDAEIGVRGPIQNLDISMNDASYLQGNSCVYLQPTICDPILNLARLDLSESFIEYSWTNTNSSVTVEYGPSGFTPGTGTVTTVNGTNQIEFVAGINGLLPGTTYDVYFHTNCGFAAQGPVLIDSFEFASCTAPNIIDADVHYDTLIVALDNTNTNYSFNYWIDYKYVGSTNYTQYSSVFQTPLSIDSIVDNNLNTSMMLEVCAHRYCYNQGVYVDSSDWTCYPTPIPANAPINSTPSTSTSVSVNGVALSYTNQNIATAAINNTLSSTISTGNTQTGWLNGNANNVAWFNFVAPASGSVIIDATGIDHLNKSFGQPMNVANKAAIFSTTDVNNSNAFTLISANDNSMFDTNLVSFDWVVCGLIPGNTYFMMYSDDDNTAQGGEFSLRLTDPDDLDDIQFVNNPGICMSAISTDLNNLLTQYPNEEGVWFSDSLEISSDIIGSHLILNNITGGQVPLGYISNLGCASDTISVFVQMEELPQAGVGTAIHTYKNCPVNLFTAFDGQTINLGGTWYDFQWNEVVNYSNLSGNIPGQYNYYYVVQGTVCPSDTATVLLIVDPSYDCNASTINVSASIEVELFPNPTQGKINLRVLGSTEKTSYRIYDTKGSSLQDDFIEIPVNEMVVIDVQELRPSIYFIEIKKGEYTTVERLVVQ
ncbi:GEVED domain-containing protein [Lishizhenia sp.]|uniref:GEVED domain-containing protein n=1 Tax=Lishizhenia sp. TaxID=2497594 RepID=UPI00299DF8D6|nr:GEVED domain-containing protein [Lishizhenia sp.]MDX1446720.1 GEVED domain-containing protein [Lishizhenia sp.]